jgi:hypothetical protein
MVDHGLNEPLWAYFLIKKWALGMVVRGLTCVWPWVQCPPAPPRSWVENLILPQSNWKN